MHIVVHTRLSQIDANQWNQLVDLANPFVSHEFLNGLEACGCVSPENGWQPHHLAIYDQTKEHLLAAMPCYIKNHSYGEYIFDWSWVNAYHSHGIDYYPKLSNAVPFTPATGPRVLTSSTAEQYGVTQEELSKTLIDFAVKETEKLNLSSFHSLFNTQAQSSLYQQQGLSTRQSTQFHWKNNDYASFDDFLGQMSSKKRKNIKRERRRVNETGVTFKWLSGNELSAQAAATMYKFYSRTIAYYGAQSYLNKSFFEYIATHFSNQTLFLFAEFENQIIAGGLYFKGEKTLYGRYWGALANFHSVHFETCYYQAIQWCIEHGYDSFEAGAQGEHKLARGLEPTTTYSSHWIAHPEFRKAISSFLSEEENHVNEYQKTMQAHSPYKTTGEGTEL